MKNYFFKNFKNLVKDKSSFKMMNTNINSNLFKITFSNKSYFYKLVQIINSYSVSKNLNSIQTIGSKSGLSFDELSNNLKLNSILGTGIFY